MIRKYLELITRKYLLGDAREESYYEVLSQFLYEFAEANGYKIDITTLPKATEAGNPDFRVWDGKAHVTGYIEAKVPTVENLDNIQVSEQLERYIGTFPNVLLTNFHEFRLFRDGNLIERVSVARFFTISELRHVPEPEKVEDFNNLLHKFLSFRLPRLTSAAALAIELAKRTRFLRDEVIKIELEEEARKDKKPITGFYEAFHEYLIKSITKEEFADLYSQTLTYGLFASRTRSDGEFNRETAYRYIPHTIGILREIFSFISLEEPPPALKVLVDDIAEILHVTDVNKILKQYYKDGKGNDPIIHFYETFLKEYDPSIRVSRGVYYTPEPVVKYIVKSLHEILKSEFDLGDGLAAENVTVLDPAAGTLTFPAEAIKVAVAEYSKYGKGGMQSFIRDKILKNYYAFELMMAPYAIGHLKMGFIFEELGFTMCDDDRFKLYLTNTLEMEEREQVNLPFYSSLAEENHEALVVKRDMPVLVIMGNPPYSGISSNNNEWTENLMKTNIDGAQSYYTVDGKDLGERNPKWLQDDYVKFLRFAQWKIQKAGKGVVGIITNHSYLDNPTFRGMRQSLLKTFDKVYIINLHGNSVKRESCSDGSKDENVFDIKQGVAIALFIKTSKAIENKAYYYDIFGLRKDKYNWLEKESIKTTDFEELNPASPYYFMIRRDTEKIKNYLEWDKVNEVFPVNSVGIVTARDNLTIHFSKASLKNTVYKFSKYDVELARMAYSLGKDARDWKIKLAQEDLNRNKINDNHFNQILYRPFDSRWTYYTGKTKGFHCMPRNNIMRHMLNSKNLGLVIGRQGQVVGDSLWNLSFITDKITDFNLFYRGGGVLLPLYIYRDNDTEDIFERMEPERKANIAPEILERLTGFYGKEPEPEAILYYIYGIFYSNIYRKKYWEYLKIDFPRVPFTKERELFYKMAAQGERLISLHLMQSRELEPPVVRYEGVGTNDVIEIIQYIDGRVYINTEKYFEGIMPEVWNYQIGGYQVLRKYLHDRKGRNMEDARHYCRVATALSLTIEIQKEIDIIFEECP